MDWPTYRSLPVGVGEDSMDLHLALVGLGHIHPQLTAAGLVGAIQTGHIVVVVVLLPPPETETTGGMRSRVGQEPSSALPGKSPPSLVQALWPRVLVSAWTSWAMDHAQGRAQLGASARNSQGGPKQSYGLQGAPRLKGTRSLSARGYPASGKRKKWILEAPSLKMEAERCLSDSVH